MRNRTSAALSAAAIGVAVVGSMVVSARQVQADDPNSAPNPYHVVENWAKLPQGRVWGQAIGVDIDRDGTSVWIYDRCGGKTCEGSWVAPIQKFDASGRLVVAFGSDLINWPHGIYADRDGNVWVTDGRAGNDRGDTAIKFAPDGHALMTLGKAGVAGDAPGMLNGPSDVVVAPNGDIFVADGHGEKTNDRMVKFSKDGKFIKAWGHHGSGPGEFDTPTASPWIRPVVCSSPTGPTTASRFSIRTENSLPNGSSSGGRAGSISATTFSMSQTRNRATK
jgi:hypothetical protein